MFVQIVSLNHNFQMESIFYENNFKSCFSWLYLTNLSLKLECFVHLMNQIYNCKFKMATTFSKHGFYVFAFLGHTRVLLHQSRSSGQGTGWGDLQQSTGQGRGHRIPAVHTVFHHSPSLTNLEWRTVGKESISISNIYQNIWVNWYLQNKCVTIKCLFFCLSVITT